MADNSAHVAVSTDASTSATASATAYPDPPTLATASATASTNLATSASATASLSSGSSDLLEASLTSRDSSLTETTIATSTLGVTSASSVDISVPTSLTMSGGFPIYDLGIYAPNITSYGNSNNKNTKFTCTNGCPLRIDNYGYSQLWCAVIEGTPNSVPAPPHIKFSSLVSGNNSFSVDLINQDDVDWRNESRQYTWGLFDSQDSITPIATSGLFEIHINDWDYSAGLPQAVANGSVSNASGPEAQPESGLSGGAKAGIAVGVLLIACIASLLGFIFMRRRKRSRRRTNDPSNVYEKGIDNPSSKPELMGTMPATSGVVYRKPGLEATTRVLPSEISSSDHTLVLCEGGTGAPTEADREQEERLAENERLVPRSMEVRGSQTGETSSSSTPKFSEGNPRTTATGKDSLNFLKAQERELAHRMEVSESLQRLRAEHTALLDRIRIAELREREVREGV